MLELWKMWSTHSLPSLPGSLLLRVVTADRVLSMSWIELNSVFLLNWTAWNGTVWQCDNIPTCRSQLSQPPKPAHGHPILKWFLSSPVRGISYCFTNTQDTTYTTEKVEEKKNKQERTWVSSKHKKGEFFFTLLAFCASVGYCKRVCERNSYTATRNVDSSSHVGQPGIWIHRS